MKNIVELSYVYKLMQDNVEFYKTKVKQEHFTDLLAGTLYREIGKAVTQTDGFIPFKHLSELIKDTSRMDDYRKTKYPLEINEPKDIMSFLEANDQDCDMSVLEKNIIKDYKRKQFENMVSKMNEKISVPGFGIEECLRKFSWEIDQMKFDADDGLEFHSMTELVDQEIAYQDSDEVDLMYNFGLDIIDGEVGGTPKPSTNYLLASPKSGKSTALYNLALSNLRDGRNILFVTIEIPTKEATRKLYAHHTGLNYKDIVGKKLSDDHFIYYKSAISQLSDAYNDNFYMIYNKDGVDVKQIEIYCENLKKSGIIIDDIYIDYLTLLNSMDEHKKSDVEKFMSLPKEVRILSQKTNTRVFSAGQLDVGTVNKPIEDVTLSDAHYVKNALSQEATNVLFMQIEENGDRKDLKIKHLLGRLGMNDKVYQFCKYDFNKVTLGKDTICTVKEASF